MSMPTLPESVRQSALILALDEKLRQQQPVVFDYWGKFKDLRERVSAQVGDMKVLFPEFTAHDEPQHLARLFGIADKLLGSERFDRMNAAELFLLACGLYAHDWGMAVGRVELEYLRSFCASTVDSEVFTPLDDERQRLNQFVTKYGIGKPGSATLPVLTDDHLRQYIRETHAWRSGVRARAFFHASGSGVPQAIERVCQGHWLDFSQLDDDHRFSGQQGILGHTVNLRAVAIYVRLVDLFDIADDRTPYAVWRFVSPADGRSAMEWKKHRALSPVTFPQHGDGRCVRFDGLTTDPEVWAELEDLRRYCEEQIDGSMDLLARHLDVRHQLDLRKLDWRVTAERFKPISIRFEFHRERMFSILADEIYQGDSHVFLRELLQNSIDAVRLRKALLERRNQRLGTTRNVGLGFDDAIYFKVTHSHDGGATVVCRDFGIGMDDYIVRNYLAVAGVSYYQSEDFRRQGLNMDPISRFGVGILSCFMVANRIEIETCREPQSGEARQPLHIDVPAVDKQFRIFVGTPDADIGTAVTVHVIGSKLKSDVRRDPTDVGEQKPNQLKAAEYLKAIAGFVEFPIIVDESGTRTVILHPELHATEGESFKLEGSTFEVWQKPMAYAWDRVFAPQDAHLAEMHLMETSLDLKKDLGLENYEGSVTYIIPRSKDTTISRAFDLGASGGLVVHTGSEKVHMRCERVYGSLWMGKSGLSRSSQSNHALAVYRDGLLLADAEPPKRENRILMFSSMIQWPPPSLRVNLPKDVSGVPDVSRRALLGTATTWDELIWRGVTKHLATHTIAEILKEECLPRIRSLSKLAHFYHLTSEELAELVPSEKWPLPTLMPGRGVEIRDGCLSSGGKVWSTPSYLNSIMKSVLGWESLGSSPKSSQAYLHNWKGESGVAILESAHIYSDDMMTFWIATTKWQLERTLHPLSLRFVSPPFPGLPALSETEYIILAPKQMPELKAISAAAVDPSTLDPDLWCALRSAWWSREVSPIINAVPFAPPFETFFLGPAHELNLRHPMTLHLIRCAASIRLQVLNLRHRSAIIGQAEDQMKLVAESLRKPETLNRLTQQLVAFLKCHKMLDFTGTSPSVNATDYVPVPKNARLMQRALRPGEKEKLKFAKLTSPYFREFGFPLTTTVPEEVPETIVKVISKLN